MATNTTNYNLVKPADNETADIQVVNGNMDIIDLELKDNSNKINVLNNDVTTHLADYVRQPAFGPTTGVANTYLFTTDPAPTAYVDGMSAYLDINIANTGASTLNWNNLGAKPIVTGKGVALTAGKLPLNSIIGVRYNASAGNFQLLGEGGEYGTALPSDVRSTKTLGTENGVVPGTLDLTNLIAGNIKKGITVGGINGTYIDNSITAGNNLVIDSGEGESVAEQYPAMKKVREIKISRTGTVRVKFDIEAPLETKITYGQIYKNGVAVGILRTVSLVAFTTFTEDFTVNANDLIQLYVGGSQSFMGIYRYLRIYAEQTPMGSINIIT